MKLTIVTDEQGEWEVLYVNGVKFEEGHSITAADIIDAMLKYDLIDSVDYKSINNQKHNHDKGEGIVDFYDSLNDYSSDDFRRP